MFIFCKFYEGNPADFKRNKELLKDIFVEKLRGMQRYKKRMVEISK